MRLYARRGLGSAEGLSGALPDLTTGRGHITFQIRGQWAERSVKRPNGVVTYSGGPRFITFHTLITGSQRFEHEDSTRPESRKPS
jgi:hypothetical protein